MANKGSLSGTSRHLGPLAARGCRMSHVRGRWLAIGVALGMLLAAIVATGPGVAATEDAAVDLPSAPIAVIGGELTPAHLKDLAGLAEERGMSLEETDDRGSET